jgi:hypothetical protein
VGVRLSAVALLTLALAPEARGERPVPAVVSVHAPVTSALTPRDSVGTLRTAQHALRLFFIRFRTYANTIPPLAAMFVCEKSVGAYCVGPLNGKLPFAFFGALPVEFRAMPTEVPRPLRRKVNSLVADLMKSLDNAQKKLPGDRWIMGQRVFHLVEHGEIERADTVARRCESERWWCAALVGYTSHLLAKTPRADSAFAVTLTSLPADERCRWEDVSDLVLGDGDRDWYTHLSCDERAAVNETLWWLADPLYLMPGNERRTEHYYRMVYAQLFRESNDALPPGVTSTMTPPPLPGGRTLSRSACMRADPERPKIERVAPGCGLYERALWESGALPSVLRSYGSPAYLVVEAPPPGTPPMGFFPDFLLQYTQPTYHFLPQLSAVRAPLRATSASWNLYDEDAPERYHPLFDLMRPLSTQIAFFRRGDASRIIAAADVARTRLVSDSGPSLVTTALILSRGPTDLPRIMRDSAAGIHDIFDARAPSESTLVSIEALAAGLGAARARFATGPPPMPAQRVALSDVLLLDRADSLPTQLNAAVPHAAPGSTTTKGRVLGVFWEVYGLAANDTVTFALSATEIATSTLTRIGRVLGVTRDAPAPRIVWTEPMAAPNAIEGRSVAIDLSALGTGRYTMRLEVSVPGQVPVSVRRDFEIVDR